MGSDPAGVVVGEGLMPEDLGTLAHEVVIAEGLALLADAVLGAVDEVLSLFVAVGLEDAVEEDVFVLDAGGLVLIFRGPQGLVDGFEETSQPPVEPVVGLLEGIQGRCHNNLLMNVLFYFRL